MLTYARLQGRNSLIEHFHNSKVLNQKEKRYRPIIKEMSKLSELLENQRKNQ
jgi:sulfur transfer protein SufE